MDYKVIISWDAENKVFFVVESEIIGLWAEAPSMAELLEVIEDLAPDLLRQNHPGAAPGRLHILEDRGRLTPMAAG